MIELMENACVKNARTLYEMIGRELEEKDEILIDFARVGRLDLSLVQIVIAAARSAREKGKTVRLKSVSAKIREQLEICGIKA